MPKRKLKKRADGRYEIKIYIGLDENRRKKYKTVYGKTPSEVEAKERELKSKLSKGIDITTMDDSFSKWAKRYAEIRKTDMSESEYKTLKFRTEYFADRLGNIPLKDISQVQIQPIVNELFKTNPSTGKPSGKGTLQKYLRAASLVFEFAIESRATDFNPCKYVKIPKQAQTKTRRALSAQERQWIEETPHEAQTAAMLLLYSGLRRGEATALLWSDVDLENGIIKVTKSYDFKAHETKSPKTASGIRNVTIPTKLVNFLKNIEHTGIYVITNKATNGMMTDKAWKTLWNDYLLCLSKKYGQQRSVGEQTVAISIEPFTPHCLRHTFCTMMHAAGTDVLTAKEQMGHSDIKTTLAIYTHLDSLYKKKNLNKLDNYLQTEAAEN